MTPLHRFGLWLTFNAMASLYLVVGTTAVALRAAALRLEARTDDAEVRLLCARVAPRRRRTKT
ncbi:MAG: hypothetical protein K2X51_12615 [Burkholderiales bacterium]|nr:hypothetical protein [Burkholderiales bacterium]